MEPIRTQHVNPELMKLLVIGCLMLHMMETCRKNAASLTGVWCCCCATTALKLKKCGFIRVDVPEENAAKFCNTTNQMKRRITLRADVLSSAN